MSPSPTTIDQLSIDLLENILARLPAIDFASANGASSLLHHGCSRVLCRPKLLSACSLNRSVNVAVEEVVNKILSEPMRPHFAIASIDGFDLQQAEQLITARLGSNFPIITHTSDEFIERDALSQEFKETQCGGFGDPVAGILLTVGFLPGMKVKKIPVLVQNVEFSRTCIYERAVAFIDKFVTNIREFSISNSGCNSPAAIIMIGTPWIFDKTNIMEELDRGMSPETVIVGGDGSPFEGAQFDMQTDEGPICAGALALVFVMDMNKPLGIKETQFHSVSTSGLLALGPTYEVTSVSEKSFSGTCFAARRVGSYENSNKEIIWGQAIDEVNRLQRDWYIGVSKTRKCSTGDEKLESFTSFAFHFVFGNVGDQLRVSGIHLNEGDTFRFYRADSATGLSSAASACNYFKKLTTSGSGGDERVVFGGLVFYSAHEVMNHHYSGQASIGSCQFLDNFPGLSLGVIILDDHVGRSDLTAYVKETRQQKSVVTCVNRYGATYLIMSYTP